MQPWHGYVVSLNGDSAVLKGPSLLPTGMDAARVRLGALRAEPMATSAVGLATTLKDDSMALIIESREDLFTDDVVELELEVVESSLRAPARASKRLFGIDPTDLSADDRRWLCQAVMFALEADDAALRAQRLAALGILTDD